MLAWSADHTAPRLLAGRHSKSAASPLLAILVFASDRPDVKARWKLCRQPRRSDLTIVSRGACESDAVLGQRYLHRREKNRGHKKVRNHDASRTIEQSTRTTSMNEARNSGHRWLLQWGGSLELQPQCCPNILAWKLHETSLYCMERTVASEPAG